METSTLGATSLKAGHHSASPVRQSAMTQDVRAAQSPLVRVINVYSKREQEALLKEIDQRYRRKCPTLSRLELILSLRRAELMRLIQHRFGHSLPDDLMGRGYLRLLLELRMNGIEALRIAPRISHEELQEVIQGVESNPRRWTAESIGNRVELTFEEKVNPAIAARHIECFDQPSWSSKHITKTGNENGTNLQP